MKVFRSHLLVCGGTGCHASGSIAVKKILVDELNKRGLSEEIKVVETGCNGFCAQGPIMVVYPEGIIYMNIRTEDVPVLVEEHFVKGRPVERLFYKEPGKEDDEQKWLKFWILASSSQFTESVPLIGGMLGQAVSSAVMGTPAIFNEQRLPATDALAKAISRLGVALQKQEGLTSNDVEAILRLGFESSGLLAGAPTLAATGAYDFVKRILDRE